MSQKTISTSLRLKNKKNWETQWIYEKNNYSNYFFIELEIKKYIQKILLRNRKILLKDYKIKKISNNILLYLYIPRYYLKYFFLIKNLEKNLQLFLQNKYKIKIFLITNESFFTFKSKKKYRYIISFFKKNQIKKKYNFDNIRLFYVLFYSIIFKKPKLFLNVIIKKLERKKRQKGFIFFFCKILKNFYFLIKNLKGYKIQFKGRINGKRRSQKLTFKKGKISLNSITDDLYYAFDEFITPSGTCSVKIWLCFNKN